MQSLANSDISVCADIDMSSGSPKTEAGTPMGIRPTPGKGQQLGQQSCYNPCPSVPFILQRPKRLKHISTNDSDPEFPPGFSPAVRCARESPGLNTQSNKTHQHATNLNTSAAGQLSFSLAAERRMQSPSWHLSHGFPYTSQTPSTSFLDRARSMRRGLRWASQAERTASLPVSTRTAAAETTNEMSTDDAPALAHLLKSQQLGTGNDQVKQQRSSHCSVQQSDEALQQSGWDVDSDSEPGAAWTHDSNKLHRWDTCSQQDSKAFSMPRNILQPDHFQDTAAKVTLPPPPSPPSHRPSPFRLCPQPSEEEPSQKGSPQSICYGALAQRIRRSPVAFVLMLHPSHSWQVILAWPWSRLQGQGHKYLSQQNM